MRSVIHKRTSAIVAVILLVLATAGHGAEYYVAPSGDDTSPGTRDQPLATLKAARDAARAAGGGPHRIVVMPGDYFLAKTLELDARDSGLTIEAAETGKATLYGGTLVTGWRRDGEKFWCADLPGVKDGTWDFRALVVNGRLAERARMPAEGTFLHKSVWNVRYLSSVAGGFERKPTEEELTTLVYDPEDVPATLDARNAEVRVYHMWNESLVPVARNDAEWHTLVFAEDPIHPPGAFGVRKYVIFNTREGMTPPGQWYLDRTAGRVVYWPLPDEEMTGIKVVAPCLECIISVLGSKKEPVEDVTVRGLVLEATTTPINRHGSFGASAFDGAVRIEGAQRCALEGLEIRNVAGQGIHGHTGRQLLDECRIVGCHIHHVGACGLSLIASASLIADNHVHHVGVLYPSAVAMYCRGRSENGLHICRNEIHDGPYSGMICSGENNRIEKNLIYRVMREMHDGGAIYGGMRDSVLRGNVVRDVVPPAGRGFGASAYYLDEGARDCLVERNVAIGVPRPMQNHIARDITMRQNVFVTDGDMQLATNRSIGLVFERNTFFAPGNIDVTSPGAVKTWEQNVVFRNGTDKTGAARPFTIAEAMPPVPEPKRKTSAAVVPTVDRPPTLDGEIGPDEWPNDLVRLDRAPSRWRAGGAPVFARLAHDDRFLYVAVNVPTFDAAKLGMGSAWGKDDGAEIAIAGKTPEGKPATFVLRGYPNGTVQSVTDAGAPAEAAERLGKAVRFAVNTWRRGWRGEWAIPLAALGLKPGPGLKVPFNLSVYRSEDQVWRCWEGTLAETWRLEAAGTLQFK